MSDLQLALIGFGAVLVIAVWGFNAWQERKHRRRAEQILPAAAPDVLMAGRADPPAADARPPRSEPGFGEPLAVMREPTFGDVGEAGDSAAKSVEASNASDAPAQPLPAEWGDGQADCLLRIEFVDAVPVAEVWAAQAPWSATPGKPVQWLGLDDKTARWRVLLPQDAGSVVQLAVALQLADRAGAVNESMLTTFFSNVHALAQRFGGLVELPEAGVVLRRAVELDAFCADVDLQLVLHVVPREGSLNEMLGAKLKPLIDAAALRLEGERFVAVDAAGAEVFALGCQNAAGFNPARIESQGLASLAFSIDVPRVAEGAAGFDRMLGFARQCAETLGGQLADPHKKPLPEATIEAIRLRIADLQGQMLARGIPAGSVRALRLFS